MVDSQTAYPRAGERLPEWVLPDLSGQPVNLDHLRGVWNDWNLLVLFSGLGEQAFTEVLDSLLARQADFAAETARIALVVPGGGILERVIRNRAEIPFTILLDAGGELHRQLQATDAAGQPALAAFVADRFGNIYNALRPGDSYWPPETQELLDWLNYIEIQCPE